MKRNYLLPHAYLFVSSKKFKEKDQVLVFHKDLLMKELFSSNTKMMMFKTKKLLKGTHQKVKVLKMILYLHV